MKISFACLQSSSLSRTTPCKLQIRVPTLTIVRRDSPTGTRPYLKREAKPTCLSPSPTLPSNIHTVQLLIFHLVRIDGPTNLIFSHKALIAPPLRDATSIHPTPTPTSIGLIPSPDTCQHSLLWLPHSVGRAVPISIPTGIQAHCTYPCWMIPENKCLFRSGDKCDWTADTKSVEWSPFP